METARILIVEDEGVIAAYLEKLLITLGYEVIGWEATGEEAISTALKEQPDLLLMDITLAGAMTGIQAAGEIWKKAEIPVIFLTGYTDEPTLAQAKLSAAYAYLTKPVRERELRASLEMALYKHRTEQRLEHLGQVLRSIREVDQLLTRERNPRLLLEKACQILVQTRGYRLVWIGQLVGAHSQLVASAGEGRDFLEVIFATANPDLPCTLAMQTKKPVICAELMTGEDCHSWRTEARRAGFDSSAAIPMLLDGEQLGVVCVFADQRQKFDEEEVGLLLEVAGDLAFGLKSIQVEIEHRQAEEKLRENERRFQALIEKAADLIAVISGEGVIRFVSPSIETLLGYRSEEILDRNLLEWIHPEDLPAVQESLVSRSQTPGTAPASLIVRCRHKNGGWRMIEALGTNLLAEPFVQGIVLNIRDVTESQEAQNALRESEARYRLLAENSADVIWTMNVATRQLTYVSPSVTRMTGFTPDEMRAQPIHALLTGDSYQLIAEGLPRRIAAFAAGDQTVRIVTDLADNLRRDGSLIPTEVVTTLVPDATGRVVEILGVSREITRRKQAENSLQKRNEQIRLLYEAGQALNRTLNLDDLYQTLDQIITEVMPCNHLFISSYERETGLIRCVFAADEQQKPLDVSVFPAIPLEPEGHGIQSQVIRTGQPWLLNDYQAQLKNTQTKYYVEEGQIEEAESVSEDEEVTRSGLVLPLRLEGQVVGVLQVLSSQLNAYSEENFNFALALAAQFSVAGNNALLYQQAQVEIAERERAEKARQKSEERYRSLFEDNPAALWEEDFSEVKQILEALKEQGVTDFRAYLTAHMDLVAECALRVKVLDINRASMELFKAQNKEELITGFSQLFDAGDFLVFAEELTSLAEGQTRYEWEGWNRTLSGELIYIRLNLAVVPGYEVSLAKVIVTIVDVTERKQAELALQKSENSTRAIYRSMAEMLVLHEIIYDPAGKASDYRILDCNTAYITATGLPREQLIGTLASQLYGLKEIPFLDLYARVAETGETVQFETHLAPFNKDFSISVFSPEKGRFATLSSDISGRKAAEVEIKRHLSELEVLYENGLSISRLLEPRQIGEKLIEILSQKLDWHHATIRVIQPETDRLELLGFGHPGLATEELEAQMARLNQIVTDSGQGLSGWVIRHGEPVRCAHVRQDKRYLETYPGIQSGLYVPIQAGERTIGVIAVESETPDAFSEQDQRLLMTIASQAAISIQNAQLFTRVQQELAARAQVEQALLESQAELERRVVERTAEVQDLYDHAPCGYHSLDEDGKYIHVNQTELDWLGYARDEIIGHPVREFLSEKSRADFSKFFPQFKKSGLLKDVELEFLCHDGRSLTLLVNATAVYAAHGEFKMSRSTLLDISPRKQIELALRESEARLRQNHDELSVANRELEKAARLKDEFLASMSHELRTPLTGILGLSEALQLNTYGELSERQLKALRNIENSGRHLLELINDILDLSKIEAGKFDLQIEACSLAEICQASLQLTKGLAQQKQQLVSFSLDPASIIVRADARRLKQMLVNLLSNAVKFTPAGGSLGLEVLANEADERVRLTVWDKGIGIQTEDLPKLFKSFVQLDSSLARQHAGTGLGLSLVQKMAELQGGSVEVESTPGEGSRFTIVLPWTGHEQESPGVRRGKTGPLRHLSLVGGEKQPPLIVLADDNENTLEMLTDFLEARQYRVISTRSGHELLKRAPELHPDLMLVDIQMPGMDGLETIRRLRAHPDARLAQTPLVAITALAMPGDRERCLNAGANTYLSKPLKLVQLISLVDEFLAPSEILGSR
jgi:PAS domain S-box-containing protein